MAEIKFIGVNKVYDNGFQAVYDFNLDIKHGEFVVLVGPSGCGKSTMIRTIAGLESITKGEIYFDDELVNQMSPNKRGIAMVFQSYALYPHLNVAENIGFALKLEGYDEDFIDKRVKEVATILGLEALLDRKPRQLSGGQCQRVAVGRAIIRHPRVFLMDEPLSNLDAKQRVTMRSEIIEIHRRTKATTIYVTHDQVEAMTMADKIVVMRDGRIQQVGTPKDLYFTPSNKFVAGFLGDPPMNFLPAVIKGGKVELQSTGQSVDLKSFFPKKAASLEGQEVTFGFRPEAVKILGKNDKIEGAVFTSRAELTELLGDVSNIYVHMGDHKVTLKIPPEMIIEPESTVKFCVAYKDLYLFDPKTELIIKDTD